MVVYKELSSLTADLGFSAKALYSVSNHVSSCYRKVKILKANGEYRELSVPNGFLKAIQKKIVEKILVYEPVSQYATAYKYGTSVIKNAERHLGAEVVLKLDIRKFFDHIIYPLVKEKVFVKEKFSEEIRILLTLICMKGEVLPQGAPTSPVISNIIMKEFDETVGKWCDAAGIRYTRYCDDMTFSGNFEPSEVISFVKKELRRMGFFLNSEKTVVARTGQKQLVTGLIVNDKINTPISYRKNLRQELYYCKKYGIASHLQRKNIEIGESEYVLKLLGKVNFVLSADKNNKEMQEYKKWLLGERVKYGN